MVKTNNTYLDDRDEIIFKDSEIEKEYRMGLARFNCLSVDSLKLLYDKGFINGKQRHNNSPTVYALLEFGFKWKDHKHLRLTYHGWVKRTFNPTPIYHYMSIEGMTIFIDELFTISKFIQPEFVIDFFILARKADELTVGIDKQKWDFWYD